LPPAVAERLRELKESDPTRTIRECIDLVGREPIVDASTALSHSTVHRLFVRHGLNKGNTERADRGVDRRRFALPRCRTAVDVGRAPRPERDR